MAGKGGGAAGNGQALPQAPRPSFLRRLSTAVDRGISTFFYREASVVAAYPYATIVVTLLLAAACGSGLYFSMSMELDDVDLYTPRGAQSLKDIDYVLDTYGTPPLEDRVLAVSRRNWKRTNLLHDNEVAKKNLVEFMRVWETIANSSSSYNGENVTYESVCWRPLPVLPCKRESVLDAWNYDMEKLLADDDPIATLNKDIRDSYGRIIDKGLLLGGLKTYRNGEIKSAKGFQLVLSLMDNKEEIDGETYDPRTSAFDQHLVDILQGWEKSRLRPYVTNKHAVDRASDELIQKDIVKLATGYFIIVIYGAFILFRNSPAFNKSHLMLVSVVSILMAIVSAFGAVLWLGFDYNLVTATIPFLMFGLGTDDTFVIMGAYQQVDIDLPVAERVALVMGRAGSSIFVTSLTDCIAFIAGTYTSIAGIQTFCVFAAFGIFFDFLYQVTFFVAFVVLDGRREVRARNGASCAGFQCGCSQTNHDIERVVAQFDDPLGIVRKMTEKAPKLDTTFSFTENHVDAPIGVAMCRSPSATSQSSASCSEIQSSDSDDSARRPAPVQPKAAKVMQITISEATAKQIPGIPHSMSTGAPIWGNKIFGSGPYDPHKLPLRQKIVGTWLPNFTMHPLGQAVVVLLEVALMGAAVYGCTKLTMDLKYQEWFTPKGTWIYDGYRVEGKIFGGTRDQFDIFTKEAEEDYFYHQKELRRLGEATRNNPYVVSYPPVVDWYDGFMAWLPNSPHNASLVRGRAPDAPSFNNWVQEFLTTPAGRPYYGFVIMDDANERIISSRIEGYTKATAAHDAVSMVKSLRDMAGRVAGSLDAIAFGYNFVFYDGFAVVVEESVRNLLSAGLAIFLVTVVTLANVTASLAVLFMVALTEVVLLGTMYWAGITFNMVSAVNLILSVGIAVDYATHVAHSFLSVSGQPRERARGALDHIGGEVLAGAVTTWLAIAIMYFGEHYIFRVFFVMFLTTVSAAVWHGLVVLPILLTWIRPRAYSDGLSPAH
ncbi:unnamed protein product [Ostreobium quekettii]|uniref:SSD domain-containing protein n=1 Tax=Ostreobium quekettii TaxID=121088 RepID=A0A8S1JEU9_9CHLO|nr:unnamed protein product [Ostreobium quekettii]|eukprot:evm.model.scf_1279.2 EVM.evm.TU.scf_1279.2   scf_1279:16162-31157(+)